MNPIGQAFPVINMHLVVTSITSITTSFAFLGGVVTKMRNLSAEIDRWIHAGWMGFRRHRQELYDRLKAKASLLHLKVRMVMLEVVEALLYGCVTWTSLRSHCN